jgi:murein DD-endopeptidase MepM/ murein hydrolase activator NlpD
VKKNSLPEDNIKKGTKGFYAALGISVVMIGSACFFAYDSGEPSDKLASPNTVVDKRQDNIPKQSAYSYTITTSTRATAPVTTTVVTTTARPPVTVTIPAAEITIDVPKAEAVDVRAENVSTSSAKLETPHPPLADTGNVLAQFSGGELIKSETTGAWQTHNGTDFKAEVGAEVYAVSSGEITSVDDDPLWGVTAVLDHHNGFITKYCGLGSDLSVQPGDVVASGDLIGVVGNTADIESAAEPHLHVELTHNGKFVDILNYIG